MRKSMLQELYFGRISPWERKRVHTQEYHALTKKIDGIVVHFKNLLSSEEYAKFEEMQTLQAQADIIDDVNLFEYSFCLGAALMMDILSYEDND